MTPRAPRISVALALGALAAGGCIPEPEGGSLSGVGVVSAELQGVRMGVVSVLSGRAAGRGTLVIVDDGGETQRLPVKIRGRVGGELFDLSLAHADAVPVGLPFTPYPGDGLFATYSGSYESLALGVGVQSHHLRSDDGVEIDFLAVGGGIGLTTAFEHVALLVDE